ncbi:Pantothenate precursors transporter PanS [BD1-7 clade bacterium]|uniref:Pantothenates transporter PanS n=1 Tax=BD1-7 clade bacterium TaxID=2029982 RepID=A0A5S9PJT0_9GAMM|nr:Pantothenate precursors transporter PanS [BD1-7 clade bacterium]
MSASDAAVTYFLPFSLAMITLAMGLDLKLGDFKALWQKPKAAMIGIIGQIFLLPGLAFAIAWALQLPAEFAVGLVLVSACPGGAHSNLFTNLAKGDVALSISLTAISGLICIVSIPAYVYLSTITFTNSSEVIQLPITHTVLQLLLIVIVPLIVGMFIKHRWEKPAIIAEKIVKGFAVLLLALIIVGAVAKGWDNVVKYAAEVGAAIILLNVLAMSMGALLAKIGRLPGQQIAAITMEVGVQNTTLAFGIAMSLLDNFMIAIPAMIYALWVYIAAFSSVLVSRRLLKETEWRVEGAEAG